MARVILEHVVQQVADPIGLYDAPTNRFVAGFIGTAPMNFFEGQLARRGSALVLQVKDSNASMGMTFRASNSGNKGHNVNWLFAPGGTVIMLR